LIQARSPGNLQLHRVFRDSWGSADGAATVSISDSTAYTIRARVKQGIILAQRVGQSASIQTSSAMTVGAGEPGR